MSTISYVNARLDRLNGFSYDMHKNGEVALLERLQILNPRVVLDVGANVGDWTSQAVKLFDSARIFSFEIAPDACAKFRDRQFGARVSLLPIALGSVVGEVAYKDYGPLSGGNTVNLRSTFLDRWLQHTISVTPMNIGDSFCKESEIAHIDILKVDVEGSEMAVLEGFGEMLSRQAVRLVQFEYGYNNGDVHVLMRDFFDFFQSFGYEVGRVTRDPIEFGEFRYSDNDFRSGPNFVAVQKSDVDVKVALARPVS